jgi:hypothetical protein
MQGISKRALQFWELIEIYSEDMYSVSMFHNVAKYTEFHRDSYGSMIFTGNEGCFKKSFAVVFQMLLWGVCSKRVYT